jgi:hypothetical protein
MVGVEAAARQDIGQDLVSCSGWDRTRQIRAVATTDEP